MYGWEDGGSHEIVLTNRVEVEVVDDGLPFDPLHDKGVAGPQTTSRGVAIGGRGLRFVRKLMNDIRYERSQGCNRLTLIKNIAPQPSL